MVTFRAPISVLVAHSAEGSRPGTGIIALSEDGASGRLAGVRGITNRVDTAPVSAPGGRGANGFTKRAP